MTSFRPEMLASNLSLNLPTTVLGVARRDFSATKRPVVVDDFSNGVDDLSAFCFRSASPSDRTPATGRWRPLVGTVAAAAGGESTRLRAGLPSDSLSPAPVLTTEPLLLDRLDDGAAFSDGMLVDAAENNLL